MSDRPIYICGKCGKRFKHFDEWLKCCDRFKEE